MKRFFLAAIAIAALFIAGCASQETTSSPAPAADPREAVATAVATCATAVERIATAQSGDAASRVVAIGALERMCGAGASHLVVAAQPAPVQPGLGQTLLSAALQVGDLFVRGYGLKLTRDIGIVQSNNQASTSIASYGAFTQLGASIERAGVAGYRYVQAPGATTTITNTLSGTGVLGSGSYTGPVTTTTTTTCTTGAAGYGGGTTTGAAGGASGGASC